MVEFHAHPSAARGWSSPPARIVKYRLLSPGRMHCAVDFLTIFSLPCLGSFWWHTTESLSKNLWFWSLLSLSSVLITASHGGYSMRSDGSSRAQYGLSANCFLATSLGMLTLAVVLGHPNILNRQWVSADSEGSRPSIPR
jgi:drug/metabolite transporter (DMT)-like permease